MIAPDMATMLSFVFTDAELPASVLQELLVVGREGLVQRHHGRQRHVDQRHAAAVRDRQRRASSTRSRKRATNGLRDFREKLDAVLLDLALQVVRDGEGAQKLIEVECDGRGVRCRRAAHRALHRQFAAGENGDRRRRRQLGPRRHGGGQGGRGGRPRPAQNRFRRTGRGRERRARRVATTRRPPPRPFRAAK